MKERAIELGTEAKRVNLARHEVGCKICAHLQRAEIERDFVNWRSPATIARQYKLRDRTTLYRHAWALGLMEKRRRNVRAALERLIEHAGEVEVNANAVVQAVVAYAKINAEGRLVERSERVNLNDLFERITREELEAYAREGKLPAWFQAVAAATDGDGQGEETDG